MTDAKQYEEIRKFMLFNLSKLIEIADENTIYQIAKHVSTFTDIDIQNSLKQTINNTIVKNIQKRMNSQFNSINNRKTSLKEERLSLYNEMETIRHKIIQNLIEHNQLEAAFNETTEKNYARIVEIDKELLQINTDLQ